MDSIQQSRFANFVLSVCNIVIAEGVATTEVFTKQTINARLMLWADALLCGLQLAFVYPLSGPTSRAAVYIISRIPALYANSINAILMYWLIQAISVKGSTKIYRRIALIVTGITVFAVFLFMISSAYSAVGPLLGATANAGIADLVKITGTIRVVGYVALSVQQTVMLIYVNLDNKGWAIGQALLKKSSLASISLMILVTLNLIFNYLNPVVYTNVSITGGTTITLMYKLLIALMFLTKLDISGKASGLRTSEQMTSSEAQSSVISQTSPKKMLY